MMNPGPFQHHVTSVDGPLVNGSDQGCLIDAGLSDRLNETIMIADRISGPMQPDMLGEGMLLGEELEERMGGSLSLIGDSQEEISIDSDLLTLKPKCLN